MKKKILVVEDDVHILTGLNDLLMDENYQVFSARDGEKALSLYRAERPDLILLDIMIPEKSGYDVCKEIRKKDPRTPILMLTAKGQEVDKIVGLELGADDYIVKPFSVNELLARIRAVLRRSQLKGRPHTSQDPIQFGDITVDIKKLKAYKGKKEFDISPREVELLRLFSNHDGQVLDRWTLLDEIWGIQYTGTTRTLDQHIANLRKKIEDNPAQPRHILTVHGVGYRFNSKGE